MVTDPLAYTIQDACKATGLGRTKLYALISQGKLDARKAGSRTLIPADSLKRYIDDLAPAAIKIATRERA
jgi:excisionase family DNA binding protein